MTCLDTDVVLAWLANELRPEEVERLEGHVDACAQCRSLLAHLARATTPASDAPQDDDDGASAAPLRRGERVGRYEIADLLGRGGMGEVYAARDPELRRKVALKLLGGGPAEGQRGERLQEAQAMARVDHPNVVAVYDVGVFRGRVFLAMEHVEGRTLRAWLRERRRRPREVLEVLLAAGSGLAAIHRAGLVHRDFKPENVLLGEDGRVRLADFGLASEGERAPGAGDDERAFAGGTPGYMAPEQRAGGGVDARADQYAFAVTLFEALTGARPSGARAENLADTLATARLPKWQRRLLSRGMAAAPEERFSSMEALLEALQRPLRVRRRLKVALLTAPVVVAAAAVLALVARDPTRTCRERAAQAAARFEPDTLARIEAAFAASGQPFAKDVFTSVETMIEGRLAAWSAAYDQSCRRLVSAADDDAGREIACLERRDRELAAALALFAEADGLVVEHAAEALRALPAIDSCIGPPAGDRRRDDDTGAEVALTEVELLLHVGREREAAARLEALLSPERHPRLAEALRGRALLLRGALAQRRHEPGAAAALLEEAALLLEATRQDELVARARADLVRVVGYDVGDPERARSLAAHARAAVARLGSPPLATAKLEQALAAVAMREGQLEEARQRAEVALRRLAEPGLASTWERARAHHLLGAALTLLERYDEARAHHERALALMVSTVGPKHPSVAAAKHNLAAVAADLGDEETARRLTSDALSILREARGAEHPSVAEMEMKLGVMLLVLGETEEARAHVEAAIAIYERAPGSNDLELADALSSLAEIQLERRDYEAAASAAERSLAKWDALPGGPLPERTVTLGLLGEAYLGLGRAKEAARLLDETLTALERDEADPRQIAAVQFALARAEAGLGRERRAALLARAALAIFSDPAGRTEERAQEVEAWLQARGHALR